MHVRIANREDPDKTASLKEQSNLGLHCLSRPFMQPTRVSNSFLQAGLDPYNYAINLYVYL